VSSGGAKGGSEVAPSEMERLTTVKAKIAAGRYTGWKRGREKSVCGCVWACEKVCFERDSENEIERKQWQVRQQRRSGGVGRG
jgi:hypothetical protein